LLAAALSARSLSSLFQQEEEKLKRLELERIMEENNQKIKLAQEKLVSLFICTQPLPHNLVAFTG
jgi:hypothetical protein